MKLVPLGETDAASCVDGVCEIPAASAGTIPTAGRDPQPEPAKD